MALRMGQIFRVPNSPQRNESLPLLSRQTLSSSKEPAASRFSQQSQVLKTVCRVSVSIPPWGHMSRDGLFQSFPASTGLCQYQSQNQRHLWDLLTGEPGVHFGVFWGYRMVLSLTLLLWNVLIPKQVSRKNLESCKQMSSGFFHQRRLNHAARELIK